MKRNCVVCICALAVATVAAGPRMYSQEKKEAGDTHKIVHFGDLKWTPIIKGCDLASVAGDSHAGGTPFPLRLRCADGAQIPAPPQPPGENLTLLKGTLLVGIARTVDEPKF